MALHRTCNKVSGMALFTYQQLRESGASHRRIYSEYQQVLHGVHAPLATTIRFKDLVAAARLVLPASAVATGTTALRLAGVTLGPAMPLTFASPSRSSRKEIRLVPLRPELEGLLVAPIPLALADADLTLPDLVAAADHLMAKQVLKLDALTARPELAELCGFVDERAQSFRESRVRVMLRLAGLPAPDVQHVITAEGEFVAQVDLAWPEERVCVEYEGLQHATDTAQWSKDIDRYRKLEQAGWAVIRVTSAHLRDPAAFVLLVHEALVRRGAVVPLPRVGAPWLAAVA